MGRIIDLQDMAVGTMYGPTSAVDGQLYRADGTSGVKMQLCAGVIVDDNSIMSIEGNIYPMSDNSYYIGKNTEVSPLAWKGLILKDKTNGKYYRIEMINGVITATDLATVGLAANRRRAASGFFLFLIPPISDGDIDNANDRYHNAGFYREF